MIGRLSGNVVRCLPGEILLDVGGVGYLVQIPLGTFYSVSQQSGGTVSLAVHTHVREDSLQLFGFASEEEKAAFERLLAVSGIGPRLALAVLSGIGPAELEVVVESGDRNRLERIPGVGRKTAERILLELRDRPAGRKRTSSNPAITGATSASGVRGDAVSALENLGYARDRAWQAVADAAEALGEAESLQALLRAALQRLLR